MDETPVSIIFFLFSLKLKYIIFSHGCHSYQPTKLLNWCIPGTEGKMCRC
uniref:Uncharacterized protein n=1 Tax=Solanum lycopersicum TaxID=4081 RepID=A0A3Q7IZ88_SOLLC